MKKLVSIFLILIINLIILGFSMADIKTVNAKSPYLRVINDETAFYSDEGGENLLFYLPYTYYVKIISEGVDYYHVEYGGEGNLLAIDGYVLKDALFDDALSAETRFPQLVITTANATVLYSNVQQTLSEQYVFSARQLNYYGNVTSENGEILYFVEYNNRLGYVKESEIIPFTVPIHPNPLTFIPEPEPAPPTNSTAPETTKPQTETLRYAIIGCLIFAGIFALIISIKNKPQKLPNGGYFEENEYE